MLDKYKEAARHRVDMTNNELAVEVWYLQGIVMLIGAGVFVNTVLLVFIAVRMW